MYSTKHFSMPVIFKLKTIYLAHLPNLYAYYFVMLLHMCSTLIAFKFIFNKYNEKYLKYCFTNKLY